MVGLVIVSHSAALAAGVVELARQMGGEQLRIEAAGGMAEPEGAIGTDAELVRGAIDRAASDDGVLVLMDLGSAVMSAEMAVEMIAMERDVRVVLCEAPLVEGAVAAAARAGAGAALDEVAQEARAALGMKASQLGVEVAGAPPAAPAEARAPDTRQLRLPVGNRLGIHARPAARIVEAMAGHDARVTLSDETTGRGPADARSLTALVMLAARQGHAVVAEASGPDADAALEALRALAEDGFGDGPDDGAGAGAATGSDPTAAPAGTPASGPRPAAGATAAPAGTAAPPPAPAAGTRMQGVPAAPGVALGPATAMAAPELSAGDETPGDPGDEQARLDAALAAAGHDVDAARRQVAARGHGAEAEIFDAHRSLLADSALLAPARAAIADGAAAAAAWVDAVRAAAGGLRELDDPLLRERAADVEDVGARVLRHLRGEGDAPAGPAAPGILVARDVSPGDAAALDPAVVRGLALAQGGATSHAAILARALGIPTVAGLGEGVLAIAPDTPLALDGDAGTLDVAPAGNVLAEHERHAAAVAERRRRARERAAEPARTRDGALIAVDANAGSPTDAVAAVAHGADGIGLLRTEFLFLDRADAPGETEQRAVYAEIARTLDGRPLTIRTLDAGADKPLPFVAQAPEDNPFLGVRGIRLSLVNPELLGAQLRAIVAVAAEHPVRVMLPMVAAPAELRAARRLLDEALGGRGDGPPLGVMVEVPAVALAAERYAREAAFFSIGTNDLTQYTLAAERGNPAVADLLQGPHPGVLRLVEQVVAGAAAHGRSVSVCGELASDPVAAVLLAGLGVRRLSAAAPRIPEVKAALREVTLADAREAARAALDAEDAAGAAAAAAPLLDTSQAPSR